MFLLISDDRCVDEIERIMNHAKVALDTEHKNHFTKVRNRVLQCYIVIMNANYGQWQKQSENSEQNREKTSTMTRSYMCDKKAKV